MHLTKHFFIIWKLILRTVPGFKDSDVTHKLTVSKTLYFSRSHLSVETELKFIWRPLRTQFVFTCFVQNWLTFLFNLLLLLNPLCNQIFILASRRFNQIIKYDNYGNKNRSINLLIIETPFMIILLNTVINSYYAEF